MGVVGVVVVVVATSDQGGRVRGGQGGGPRGETPVVVNKAYEGKYCKSLLICTIKAWI